MPFHPWHHLRDQHPRLTVHTRRRLPNQIMGISAGERVWICATSTQAERRSTLAHELAHIELGIVGCGQTAATERRVCELAARWLIDLDALTSALRWTRHLPELAEELWTDEATVRTRLETLDPIETATLERAVDGGSWTV